jgi:hypothetical protein
MKIAVSRVATLRISETTRRFGGTRRLHFQGLRVAQFGLPAAFAGFLRDLFLYTEDGGGTFLRNVGLSPNYMAMQPTIPYY